MILIDTTIRHIPTSTQKMPTLVFHPIPMPTESVAEITPKGKTVFSEEEALAILFSNTESKNALEKAIRKQHEDIQKRVRLGEINPVRGWRMIREIDQMKLARLTGIRQPNLSRIERLGARPSLPSLQKIAKALKISVKELLP